MSEKINLPELVNQIKQDLMQQELGGAETAPLFSVDEVTIAVQAKVTKDADAGIKIYVVELGGGGGKEDVQTITLKLSPLLNKEERIRLYKTRYPERWKALEHIAIEGGMMGDDGENDSFGD